VAAGRFDDVMRSRNDFSSYHIYIITYVQDSVVRVTMMD